MDTNFFQQKYPIIRLKKKIVIIINGKGGAGKDTVCAIAAKFYKAKNISAITPIKEIAATFGWNGEKDSRARKFLSDLKRTFIDYNDLPNTYLEEEYLKFEQSDDDILFVHIRENDQIDDFKRRIKLKCVTMIVRSTKIDNSEMLYGNYSDDHVEDYKYDYYYTNGKPLNVLVPDFMDFLYELFNEEGVSLDENAEDLPWRTDVHICGCN